MRSLAFAALALVAACKTTNDPGDPTLVYGGPDRPVTLQVPAGATPDDEQQYPLVVVLHGYGASGFVQEAYFGLSALPNAGTAFVLAPDGLVDSLGKQFWNADSECCDFDGAHPDDVGYIGGLIDAVSRDWPIDPEQVLLVGHSNGAYMAYRMACERADAVASVIALAGDAYNGTCAPSEHVNILTMHGDADDVVPFAVAAPTVAKWQGYDACGTTLKAGPALDLDTTIAGAETHTQSTDGCPAGGAVDFWTITGAGHIPSFGADTESQLWSWFQSHPRP